MAESAEVKLTTEYLKTSLENRVITDWVLCEGGQYADKNPKGFIEFVKHLPLIVENVDCKGKFIYFTMFNEKGYFYILHNLNMTGRWQEYEDRYCRWYIELDNNENVWLRDPRCFATLEFSSKYSVLQKMLDHLGPDILTEEFSLEAWDQLRQKHRNKNITSLLMDQRIISGVGNYIKSEALYYAKVSPLRKTGSLSDGEADKLFEGLRIISRVAYNKNGTSIRYFANSSGKKGEDLKIYSQSHAKKTKTSDGQITHWDPDVQV